jgi:hypothetical protein
MQVCLDITGVYECKKNDALCGVTDSAIPKQSSLPLLESWCRERTKKLWIRQCPISDGRNHVRCGVMQC